MPNTELNDPAYYRRREQQERDLAVAARDDSIRNIHLRLAQYYADLIRRSDGPEQRPQLTVVL